MSFYNIDNNLTHSSVFLAVASGESGAAAVVDATVVVRGEGFGGGTTSGGTAPWAWLATPSSATPGVIGLGSGRGGEAPP